MPEHLCSGFLTTFREDLVSGAIFKFYRRRSDLTGDASFIGPNFPVHKNALSWTKPMLIK
ncbi:hypothetical protein CW304_15860 [Bacillus sp. UFRGS-B20]|nr:hypothetical protein CW304_15860 [Bacillus sp. UFRGS-B20]